MEREKVVVFLDYANINRSARDKRCRLDYYDLLQYFGENRFLAEAYCYVPLNPRNEHRLDGEIEDLWRSGYIVHTKLGTIAGGTYRCNFDVEITMDMLKVVQQVRPDIVVLASGDADFASLIQDIRKAGIRVEVAAFAETAGLNVLLKCSGFIDLAVYYEQYLVAQKGEREQEKGEETYAHLIHAQNGSQDEERTTEKEEDAISLLADDLDESNEKLLVDQMKDKSSVPALDLIDEVEI